MHRYINKFLGVGLIRTFMPACRQAGKKLIGDEVIKISDFYNFSAY